MSDIFKIVATGKSQKLASLLADGESPDKKDEYGDSLLMISAENSNTTSSLETVKLLLEAGADPNLQNDMGETALMVSALYSKKKSSPETVKLLLRYGAHPNIQNNDGATALMMASSQTKKISSLEAVKELLRYGADPNIRDNDGVTALMLAAFNNNMESTLQTIKVLLDHGAIVGLVNHKDQDALDLCSSQECEEVLMEYLNNNLTIFKDDFKIKMQARETGLVLTVWGEDSKNVFSIVKPGNVFQLMDGKWQLLDTFSVPDFRKYQDYLDKASVDGVKIIEKVSLNKNKFDFTETKILEALFYDYLLHGHSVLAETWDEIIRFGKDDVSFETSGGKVNRKRPKVSNEQGFAMDYEPPTEEDDSSIEEDLSERPKQIYAYGYQEGPDYVSMTLSQDDDSEEGEDEGTDILPLSAPPKTNQIEEFSIESLESEDESLPLK